MRYLIVSIVPIDWLLSDLHGFIFINRERCWSRVKRTKDIHPNWFVPIEDFPEMSYKDVHDKMDKKVHSLYQRTLFALVHIWSRDIIKKYLYLLR